MNLLKKIYFFGQFAAPVRAAALAILLIAPLGVYAEDAVTVGAGTPECSAEDLKLEATSFSLEKLPRKVECISKALLDLKKQNENGVRCTCNLLPTDQKPKRGADNPIFSHLIEDRFAKIFNGTKIAAPSRFAVLQRCERELKKGLGIVHGVDPFLTQQVDESNRDQVDAQNRKEYQLVNVPPMSMAWALVMSMAELRSLIQTYNPQSLRLFLQNGLVTQRDRDFWSSVLRQLLLSVGEGSSFDGLGKDVDLMLGALHIIDKSYRAEAVNCQALDKDDEDKRELIMRNLNDPAIIRRPQ